jgi:hypothetical protein
MITVPKVAINRLRSSTFPGLFRKTAAFMTATKMGLNETSTVDAATLVRESEAIHVPKCRASAAPETAHSAMSRPSIDFTARRSRKNGYARKAAEATIL